MKPTLLFAGYGWTTNMASVVDTDCLQPVLGNGPTSLLSRSHPTPMTGLSIPRDVNLGAPARLLTWRRPASPSPVTSFRAETPSPCSNANQTAALNWSNKTGVGYAFLAWTKCRGSSQVSPFLSSHLCVTKGLKCRLFNQFQ